MAKSGRSVNGDVAYGGVSVPCGEERVQLLQRRRGALCGARLHRDTALWRRDGQRGQHDWRTGAESAAVCLRGRDLLWPVDHRLGRPGDGDAAVSKVFVGNHIAALVSRAAVLLHLVELAGALDEPVDQTLEVVWREILKVIWMAGGWQRYPPSASQYKPDC